MFMNSREERQPSVSAAQSPSLYVEKKTLRLSLILLPFFRVKRFQCVRYISRKNGKRRKVGPYSALGHGLALCRLRLTVEDPLGVAASTPLGWLVRKYTFPCLSPPPSLSPSLSSSSSCVGKYIMAWLRPLRALGTYRGIPLRVSRLPEAKGGPTNTIQNTSQRRNVARVLILLLLLSPSVFESHSSFYILKLCLNCILYVQLFFTFFVQRIILLSLQYNKKRGSGAIKMS